MSARHRWVVVQPGYTWADGRARRDTAPVLQMYDTSDLVNLFLKDPRPRPNGAALPFTTEDRVHEAVKGQAKRFLNLEYRETLTRKLFLDSHKRFYLVVCEVHCDALGFPSVDRHAICEAGFVIRRRQWEFARPDRSAAFERVRRNGPLGLDTIRRKVIEFGGREVIQRWIPYPNVDGVGRWNAVVSEPNVPEDQVYPLHPLVPDPRDAGHPAAGRTIYFGLVPTASTQLDRLGRPQFDDDALYEARCFVRQHKEGCPRKSKKPDCSGPLIWSAPTEEYQLAAAFDLIGTSYRTVNVKAPDLKALKAQAAIPGIGLRAPVRFILPEKSGLDIGTPMLPLPIGATLMGGICFRNIPLTTIVAMFVYNIFKPIVVAIFQLYYLLPLEFCIPLPGSPQVPAPTGAFAVPPLTVVEPGEDPVRLAEEIAAAIPAPGSLEDLAALAPEEVTVP